MKKASLTALCVLVLSLITLDAAGQQADKPHTATVTIGSAEDAKPFDPMVFGGFIEHFDNQVYGGIFDPGSPLADEDGFRKDVMAAIRELKVPVIRWPGGCFVDSYHWRKGVGPKREAYGEYRWGVIEPNTFGTTEFVQFCRKIGAEPYICFNGLTPVQENLDWIAYCNATEGPTAKLRAEHGHPEPMNVKYWSVGNERYDKPYMDRVHATAKQIEQLYPDVKVMCAGSQDGGRVHQYLLDNAGPHLDYISLHAYWLPRGGKLPQFDYLTAITKSEKPEHYIKGTIKSLKAHGKADHLKIAFDEWNLRAWQHPGFPRGGGVDFESEEVMGLVKLRREQNDVASQYTMADALFAASFFNACLRHPEHVTMTNIAPLVNTRGPLFVHEKGLVKRPHFHTMSLYANKLQPRVATATVTSSKLKHGNASVNVADALATVDQTGKKWTVALINRHPSQSIECKLELGGVRLNGTYEATLLTGESTETYNDVANPERIAPKQIGLEIKNNTAEIPPHALLLLEIDSGKD